MQDSKEPVAPAPVAVRRYRKALVESGARQSVVDRVKRLEDTLRNGDARSPAEPTKGAR